MYRKVLKIGTFVSRVGILRGEHFWMICGNRSETSFSYHTMGLGTLPETNSQFVPGWLEDDCFLLGPGLFSGAFTVSFGEGIFTYMNG